MKIWIGRCACGFEVRDPDEQPDTSVCNNSHCPRMGPLAFARYEVTETARLTHGTKPGGEVKRIVKRTMRKAGAR